MREARSAVIAGEDIDAFANAVAGVLRDPARRAALAAAEPQDAQAWSVDALMHKTEMLYARMAEDLIPAPSGLATAPGGMSVNVRVRARLG